MAAFELLLSLLLRAAVDNSRVTRRLYSDRGCLANEPWAEMWQTQNGTLESVP